MNRAFTFLIAILYSIISAGASQYDSPATYRNGGNAGMLHDLYASLVVPSSDDCWKGRVILTFKIGKTGKIDHHTIKVLRNKSLPPEFENAAIEAVMKLGEFNPGKQLSGNEWIPVSVWYTLPVIFPPPVKYLNE